MWNTNLPAFLATAAMIEDLEDRKNMYDHHGNPVDLIYMSTPEFAACRFVENIC